MWLSIEYCEDPDVKKLVIEAFKLGSDIILTLDCKHLYTDEESLTYKHDFIVWSNGGGEMFNCQVLGHIQRIVEKMKNVNCFKEYREKVKSLIKEVDNVTTEEMHEIGRRWRNGEKVNISIDEVIDL